jgi:hypothetical protein
VGVTVGPLSRGVVPSDSEYAVVGGPIQRRQVLRAGWKSLVCGPTVQGTFKADRPPSSRTYQDATTRTGHRHENHAPNTMSMHHPERSVWQLPARLDMRKVVVSAALDTALPDPSWG